MANPLRFILEFQRKCQSTDTVDINNIKVHKALRTRMLYRIDGQLTTVYFGVSTDISGFRYCRY
jgi:hypothetical protein